MKLCRRGVFLGLGTMALRIQLSLAPDAYNGCKVSRVDASASDRPSNINMKHPPPVETRKFSLDDTLNLTWINWWQEITVPPDIARALLVANPFGTNLPTPTGVGTRPTVE